MSKPLLTQIEEDVRDCFPYVGEDVVIEFLSRVSITLGETVGKVQEDLFNMLSLERDVRRNLESRVEQYEEIIRQMGETHKVEDAADGDD